MTAEELDALVVSAQRGDRGAFRGLVLAVHRDVRLSVAAFQVAEGMAEEIVQSAFVTAFENLGQYRPTGTFLPWLKGIARNLLLRELRARRRLVSTERDQLAEVLIDDTLREAESFEERAQQVGRLQACLERLNDGARALVEGRYLRDEPMDRLAARCKQTPTWVRVNLFRIRRVLKACLEEDAA